MKIKNGFLSFAILLIAAIIMMGGCEKETAFPSGFRKTWIRSDGTYATTLTFTSKFVKASNQSSAWELQENSGGVYVLKYPTNNSRVAEPLTIKLRNGNLEISGDEGSGENNWNGTWKKQ